MNKGRLAVYLVLTVSIAAACDGGKQEVVPLSPTSQPDGTVRIEGILDQGAGATQTGIQLKPYTDFPPRDQSLLFRQDLEVRYRDYLGAGLSSTYVDIEGSIVWTQEYLRYRVNQCNHDDAVARVFAQIDGRPAPPICGSSAPAPFPPRSEALNFRNQLETKYRNELHRSPTQMYVNIEGDIVWVSEYLRFRITSCSHADAEQRVFTEIAGGPAFPGCSSGPTTQPPPPQVAFLQVSVTGNCSCVRAPLSILLDGRSVANVSCGGQTRLTTSPGSHSVSVCTPTCSKPTTVSLNNNETRSATFTVTCVSSGTALRTP